MKNKQIGKWGEDYTCSQLIKSGYKLLNRNYRTPFGEIDIVAQKGLDIFFIEVKSSNTSIFGLPREKVNHSKLKHFSTSINYYLKKNIHNFINIKIMVAEIVKNEQEVTFELLPVEVLDDC